MRVFLDANILLDIIEGREQFLLASSNERIKEPSPDL